MANVEGYSLHSIIGKGGFGEVWDASDKITGGKVAIKIVILSGHLQCSLKMYIIWRK